MRLPLSALALIALPFAALAETAADPHAGHAMPDGVAAEWQAINSKMHEAMSVELTGDADVDFVRGMVPHHEGAVEMARLVLLHGADPEVRKLAEAVIETQEAEIAWMKAWLAERGY